MKLLDKQFGPNGNTTKFHEKMAKAYTQFGKHADAKAARKAAEICRNK